MNKNKRLSLTVFFYLPKQNLLNNSFINESLEFSPIISPSALKAKLISTHIISTTWPLSALSSAELIAFNASYSFPFCLALPIYVASISFKSQQ